jgi:hypothetical protein
MIGSDSPASRRALTEPDPLTALQRDFPAFHIWRENLHGRRRYVARSPRLTLNPHTVITDDPDEMRSALSAP